MNILDTSATSTRVPERVIGVARVPADPAHVLLLLLLLFLIPPRLHAPLQTSRRQRRIRSRIRRRLHAAARNAAVLLIAVYARRRLRGDLHVWTSFRDCRVELTQWVQKRAPNSVLGGWKIKKASSSLKAIIYYLKKKTERNWGGFYLCSDFAPCGLWIMTVLSLWVWINYRYRLPAHAYVGWRGRGWLVCCSVVRMFTDKMLLTLFLFSQNVVTCYLLVSTKQQLTHQYNILFSWVVTCE